MVSSNMCLDTKFYQDESSIENNQPPVGLNLPVPTAPSESSDYVVKISDNTEEGPFDFTIRRRSSDQIM